VSEPFWELHVSLTFFGKTGRNVLRMFCLAVSASAVGIGGSLDFTNVFKVI
jgi:hypothetical protein